jgi:hypothetical protein
VPTFEDLTWRWRVHVPERSRQRIAFSGGQIPVKGFSGRSASTQLPAGDYLLTAIVRRNHLNKWTLTVGHSDGAISTSIADEHADWLGDGPGFARGWSKSQTGQNEAELCGPGEKLTLLRLRVMVLSADGKSSHSNDEPCDGVLIWIDDER